MNESIKRLDVAQVDARLAGYAEIGDAIASATWNLLCLKATVDTAEADNARLRAYNAALRAAHDKVVLEFRKVDAKNAALRALVKDCQSDLAEWIVPDSGISDDAVIIRLLERLDGSQARAAMGKEDGR